MRPALDPEIVWERVLRDKTKIRYELLYTTLSLPFAWS